VKQRENGKSEGEIVKMGTTQNDLQSKAKTEGEHFAQRTIVGSAA